MAASPSATGRAAPLTLDYGQSTDQGSRQRNEDAALAYPTDEGVIVMVADGMGSGVDGQLFSKRAVERAQASMLASIDLPAQERVEQAMYDAAEALYRMRASAAHYGKSGSTLVIGLIQRQAGGAQAVVSSVGDSRAYLVRAGGQVELLTTDHSYTQQLIRGGVDATTALADPQGALLTHVLGQSPDRALIGDATGAHQLGPNDYLILCSDGISKVIDQADLPRLVAGRSAQEAADTLVRLAVREKQVRGRDNATAVVVRCRAGAGTAQQPRRRGGVGLFVAIGLILAALAVAGLLIIPSLAAEPAPGSPTRPVSENTVELPPTATITTVATEGATAAVPPTSTRAPSITATATATPTPSATNTRIPPTRVPPRATLTAAPTEGAPPTTPADTTEPAPTVNTETPAPPTAEPTAPPSPEPTAPPSPEPTAPPSNEAPAPPSPEPTTPPSG